MRGLTEARVYCRLVDIEQIRLSPVAQEKSQQHHIISNPPAFTRVELCVQSDVLILQQEKEGSVNEVKLFVFVSRCLKASWRRSSTLPEL